MSMSTSELKEISRKCRVEIVKMVYRAQAGLPVCSLSEIDLITALYGNYLMVKPNEPNFDEAKTKRKRRSAKLPYIKNPSNIFDN